MDSGGDEIGHVEEALGGRDIFSGVVVSTSVFGSPRWAGRRRCRDHGLVSCVRLRLGGDQVKQLAAYEAHEPA